MSVSAAHGRAFYDECVREGCVWIVREVGGIPAPVNGSGRRAMPVWSLESRARAVVSRSPEYAGFEVQRIELDMFLGRWLPGIRKDALLVGLNWSGARATGYDVDPSEVERGIWQSQQM